MHSDKCHLCDINLEEKYTKYEIARILGARSLQLAMDAPVLLKMSKEEQEELSYDVLKIAEKELSAGVLPITVKRPLPKKSGRDIKKLSDAEVKEKLEKKAEMEKKEQQQKETATGTATCQKCHCCCSHQSRSTWLLPQPSRVEHGQNARQSEGILGQTRQAGCATAR